MNLLACNRSQSRLPTVGTVVVCICLLLIQSCRKSNKAATECFQLLEALNTQQTAFVGTVTRASETAKAKYHKALEETVLVVELSDAELQERRDRIASLHQQLHTISAQSADVMTEDGRLSESAADQYKTISTQKSDVYDQLSTEMNSLQIHCSLQ